MRYWKGVVLIGHVMEIMACTRDSDKVNWWREGKYGNGKYVKGICRLDSPARAISWKV